MAGGRPRFSVWGHFNRIDGTKDVMCKKCSELIPNAKVEKLDRHILRSCDRWTENRTAAQERQLKRNYIDDRSSSATQMTQEEVNTNYSSSCEASFGTVEQPNSVQLVPSGGREMQTLVGVLRKCPFVVVMVKDCTSDSHQKTLKFTLVAPNMKPKPWKIVTTGADSQTGEYIARVTIDVVDEVNAAVGKSGLVAGIVTDNTKEMQAAWTILENERGLLCAGCGAHTMKLLLQDIEKLAPVKDVTEKATCVATFLLSHPILLERFEEERKIRQTTNDFNQTLSLPVVTRWHTTYNCLVRVVMNRDGIVEVFQDKELMAQCKPKPKRKAKEKLNTEQVIGKRKRGTESGEPTEKTEYDFVVKIVKDDTFWKLGKQVMELLTPIIEAIGLLEVDGCSTGMTYWCFVDLLKKSGYRDPSFLANSVLELIEDSWKFLHTDAMAVAFLLDPTTDPADFVDNDCMMALRHVREIAARLKYNEAQQKSAFHEASIFLNAKWDGNVEDLGIAPLEWWGIHRKKYPALFEIARRVFTMPTCTLSAAAESSWGM